MPIASVPPCFSQMERCRNSSKGKGHSCWRSNHEKVVNFVDICMGSSPGERILPLRLPSENHWDPEHWNRDDDEYVTFSCFTITMVTTRQWDLGDIEFIIIVCTLDYGAMYNKTIFRTSSADSPARENMYNFNMDVEITAICCTIFVQI